MLIISREQIDDLVRRLGSPSGLEAGIEEVRHMLEIKEALALRADAGIGGGWGGSSCVARGVEMSAEGEAAQLKVVEESLQKGDVPQAISLLQQYKESLFRSL